MPVDGTAEMSREKSVMKRNMNIPMIILMAFIVGDASADSCSDGSVTLDPASGNLHLDWADLVSPGVTVNHQATIVPPTKFTPTVQEVDAFDVTTGVYTYTYTISNATTSAQQIYEVQFETPSKAPITGKVILSVTPGWSLAPATPAPSGFGWWFNLVSMDDALQGIPPGGAVTFSFSSTWAPGPMNIYMVGDAPFAEVGEELPPCVSELLDKYLVFPGCYVKSGSRGPAISP
jgi:hypothetical protein